MSNTKTLSSRIYTPRNTDERIPIIPTIHGQLGFISPVAKELTLINKATPQKQTENYGRIDKDSSISFCGEQQQYHAARGCSCFKINKIYVTYVQPTKTHTVQELIKSGFYQTKTDVYQTAQDVKKDRFKRWIIYVEQNRGIGVEGINTVRTVLYDNHGQPHYFTLTQTRNDYGGHNNPGYYSRLVEGVTPLKDFHCNNNSNNFMYIQEDDELFPTPLSDYWIDLIKSGAIDCRFVRVLQDLFVGRDEYDALQNELIEARQEIAVQQVKKLTQVSQTVVTSNDVLSEEMMNSTYNYPVIASDASYKSPVNIPALNIEEIARVNKKAVEQTRSEGFKLLTEANKMERNIRKEPLINLRAQFQLDNPGASDDDWTDYLEQHIATLKGSEEARRKAAEAEYLKLIQESQKEEERELALEKARQEKELQELRKAAEEQREREEKEALLQAARKRKEEEQRKREEELEYRRRIEAMRAADEAAATQAREQQRVTKYKEAIGDDTLTDDDARIIMAELQGAGKPENKKTAIKQISRLATVNEMSYDAGKDWLKAIIPV